MRSALHFVLLIFALLFTISCNSATEELHELFDQYWEYNLTENPLTATAQGDHRFNDQLPDVSTSAIQSRSKKYRYFLDELYSISREQLSRDDQINYDIFRIQLENNIRDFELRGHLLPLNGWWDYHAVFADLGNRVPLQTAEDYENYLSRLRGFPKYNQSYISRMREGIEQNWVRPKAVFENYLESVEAHITESAEDHRLFQPFENFPDRVSDELQARLKNEAKEIISEIVIPEFESLLTFLADEYIPNAAEIIGISDLDGGSSYYQYLISYYTTLDISAQEIHQIGLDEVARIRTEMMEIVEETGFGDSFDGFVEFLRTDPQFYAETPEELMKETAYVLKKMDGKLPELFKTLPRLPYGIMEIPDYLAPRTATAYYSRGAADGTRAGFYAVNTYDLPSRPLYEVEALSLHEAVPGHHLQIALQQELGELPSFRSSASFTSYVEGWALYSERLGLEVGFYEDPYSNFGRLSYEMWRALRLVVDTGMHAKGWTRQQAIDYMAENSALSLHNIRSEVNRYIFWPGQALAYKMGEIKIRELRSMAEETLGDDFDVREFHDVILRSGSVPLSVLEENVMLWVEEMM